MYRARSNHGVADISCAQSLAGGSVVEDRSEDDSLSYTSESAFSIARRTTVASAGGSTSKLRRLDEEQEQEQQQPEQRASLHAYRLTRHEMRSNSSQFGDDDNADTLSQDSVFVRSPKMLLLAANKASASEPDIFTAKERPSRLRRQASQQQQPQQQAFTLASATQRQEKEEAPPVYSFLSRSRDDVLAAISAAAAAAAAASAADEEAEGSGANLFSFEESPAQTPSCEGILSRKYEKTIQFVSFDDASEA